MRVTSYIFYQGFDNSQLLLHECSDRILLPQTYAEESHIQINDLLMLTNIYNQSVCGTVYGIHTQDSVTIFAPSWMTHNLDSLELISVSHIAKISPTALCIRIHSEKFTTDPIFMKLLNDSIGNYKSLTINTRISLLINSKIEYLTIDAILPSKVTTCFVYNCGRVDIKILNAAPPPPKHKSEYLYKSPLKEDYEFSFLGTGHILGGAVDPSVSPAQAAAAAARHRFDLLSKGLRSY